jgi:hypothetical protein
MIAPSQEERPMAAKKKAKKAKKTKKAAARKAARPQRKQPETLRLREVSPGFTVNDIEKSLAWSR